MKMPAHIPPEEIAPCGVNCLACSARLNEKTPCPGCRAPGGSQTRKSCRQCAKRACALGRGLAWCFACPKFPCARIKSLNQRYMANYGVNLVQNGHELQQDRESFLAAQRARFTCPACGGIINQHSGRCSACGAQGNP